MARWYQASSSDEAGDDEEWEEELNLKLEQLRSLLRSLDPLHGAVHPEDEHDLDLFLRRQRGVLTWRVVDVVTQLCVFVAGLQEPDRAYVAGESQPSISDSQAEREMLDDADRSQTPEWGVSFTRSGLERLEEPPSLKRLRAPPGSFGSPLVRRESIPSPAAASTSDLHESPPLAAAPRGRPAELAASGASSMEGLRSVSEIAHGAPMKAQMLLEQQIMAAPPSTSHGNVVAKSKAVTQSIFETSGSLNETIAVVSHLLQRAEMRPIIAYLGYSQATCASDSLMVESLARFIHDHVDSSFKDQGSQIVAGRGAQQRRRRPLSCC